MIRRKNGEAAAAAPTLNQRLLQRFRLVLLQPLLHDFRRALHLQQWDVEGSEQWDPSAQWGAQQ